MRKTYKTYKVKISPMIQDTVILRVPKGVEINKEILKNSGYFDDWWREEPPFVNPTPRIESSEYQKKY